VNFLKAHKVWLAAAVGGLISFLHPSIQAFVVAHPQDAVAVGTVVSIATAWAKSPRQQ
jgi:hypothetical protein